MRAVVDEKNSKITIEALYEDALGVPSWRKDDVWHESNNFTAYTILMAMYKKNKPKDSKQQDFALAAGLKSAI